MANKTWNTNRTGGGTYEFSQDAQGKYVLNSVGFQKFGKLNLPELKTEATKTTTTKDTKTASTQTKEAFGNVQPFYYQGGGADQYTQKYEMTKDKSLDTSQPMIAGDTFAQARQKMTTDDAYLGKSTDTVTTKKADNIPAWAQDADKRGYENIGKVDTIPADKKQIGRVNVDKVLAERAQQKDLNRFSGMVGPHKQSPYQDAIMRGEKGVKYEKPGIPQKTTELKAKVSKTALKAVKSTSNVLSKALGFVLDNTLIGRVLGSIEETPVNKHDKGYFNVRAGDSTGQRIAGNPATDLYAGMNRVSMFGNLSKAGAKRIARREKTIATKNVSQKFIDDTNRMKNQQNDYKESVSKSKQEVAAKDQSQGQTGMGSCFIAGTKITMADGTLKNIENIIVGDKVKGYKEDNTVIKLDPTLLDTRKLYSFNNTEHYFFTSEHPFMTEEGWKSIKPEKTKERDGTELYEQLKGELKIGDKVITGDEPIEITDIKSKEMNDPKMPLYNFNVSNDNSYVADKYIVHNKGGNGGGNGGGRVICTELHSTGEMSTVDWVRDTRFTFKTLTKSHVKGYLFWAIPTVRHMKKYPLYRKIWKHIAQHRANDIAWRLGESKFDLLGRIYAGIGEPTCWLIGKFVSNKQYNELNLKNWRQA